MSYAQMAEKFGVSSRTIGTYLQRYAERTNLRWPLKDNTRKNKRYLVQAIGVVPEALDVMKQYKIPVSTFATMCGLNHSHFTSIINGDKPRITPGTAKKIMDGVAQARRERKMYEPIGYAPKPIRTHCKNGHRYRGLKNREGQNFCLDCRRDKHERREARVRMEKAMSILPLLRQDKIWVTNDGRRLTLEEMSARHRRNTQWMLRGKVMELYRSMLFDETSAMSHAHGEDMPDGVFAAFSRMESKVNEDEAKRWLEETPLMKRLSELIANDLAGRGSTVKG